MNRKLIIVALALLLCNAQVWGKPADKKNEDESSDYPEDAGGDDDGGDYDGENDSQGQSSAPVQVVTKPQTFIVPPGDTISLPCQVINGDGVLISWKRGDELLYAGDSELTLDKRMERLPNNTLIIRNARLNDTGDTYTCEALDSVPIKVMHRVIVEASNDGVRVLPKSDIDVNQYTRLTLGCEVDTKPEKMFWSREGHRLVVDRETETGIYLDIRNATRHVAGDYQCLVDLKDSDKPIVKHLKLKVRHIPEIEYDKERIGERIRHHDHYYTGMGVDTNITCIIHAHPGVTKVQWFKDGHKIKPDGERIFKSDRPKTHHVLTIRKTTKADLGQYHCRAWNDLGEATGPVIYVHDTPAQPIFKKGEVVDDAIQFQWRVISYKPIVEAELLYRKKGEAKWIEGKDVKVVSSIGMEHIIETRISGIEAGDHEAMLRTRNDEEHAEGDRAAEWGPYSEIKKFDGEYKNDTEPESVKGSAVRPTVALMTLLLAVTSYALSCL